MHPNVSSWGGNAVKDPTTGRWHLFAAEITNGCGLAHWGSNSRVIHATASTPEGPFTRADQVVGVFAHNPQMVYVPHPATQQDGSGTADAWILFHITHKTPVNIPNCTADGTGKDNHTSPDGDQAGSGNIRTAPGPNGPWTSIGSGGCNNAGPYHHPNGSWYQLCRDGGGGELYNATLRTTNNITSKQWSVAAHVAGPHWPNDSGVGRRNCEDHFMWQNKKGYWFGLHHCFGGGTASNPAVSSFSYSRDGLVWTTSFRQPYGYTVAVADGTTYTLTTRERPKLLLDADLQPAGLYNGARNAHGTKDQGKGKLGTDWTFTHFQSVGRSSLE